MKKRNIHSNHDVETIQNKSDNNNRKRHYLSVTRWTRNIIVKCPAAVKSIPGKTTKGLKHHVRGCLENISTDTTILHFGTNNVKSKGTAKDTANDMKKRRKYL